MKKALTLLLAGIVGASAMVAPASASFIQEEAYYEVAFGVKKAAAAWAPDGTYTPGEYFDIAVDESWRSSACADDANDQTAFGLDYKLALSWDETYFYTYIQFTDPNGHDNTWGADPASMWYSGAVQLNFADDDQLGESRLEYGVGLTSDTNELITNVWADYLGSGYAAKANEDYIVTVDGDVVTYEVRTPFSAFTTKEAKEGEIVSCCYVISWGNGQDYCHTQLAEGCTGNGKDAGAFAMVTLEGVGDVSAAAAAPAASAASSSLPAAYPCSGTAVPADSVLIAGEIIGMENGWDGTAASGRAAAFDGNIETFYDPATASVDWCGIDAGEEMILTKIMIHPRTTFLDRFDGATIEASNDPEFEESVEIFFNANGAASEIAFVDCTAEIDADVNTGYRYFRYINYMQHGDVAEVELYGKAKDGSNPTYGGAAAPAASASTAAPAAEVEPTLLWDFNSDEAMNDVLGGANAMSFFGDTIDGVECYEFLASGNDPYVPVNMPADNVEDVFWAKARVKNPSYATAIELFGATNGRSLSGPECTHIDVKSEDEGWYTYLIYIPDENVKTANAFKGASLTETYWEGTVEYIRLDAMWREGDDGSDSGGNMAGGESIYIDYIAFFPTKEAALAFRTADDNYAFPEQAGGAAAPAATEAPAAEATDVVAIEAYDAYQEYPAVDPIANSGAGYATAEEAVAAIGKTAISGYTFVSGTTGFGNEGPENLWDGDTATKFCSNEFPTTSIAALDGEYTIDGIIMATANDNAEYNQRSPYEWAIYGSKDGAAWTAIAYGDDYFFEETNFTYYAAAVDTTDAYKYIMFQSEGGLSGTFQVSEVVVCGAKVEAAAPVVEEPVVEEPVVEEPVVEEPVVEEVVEETVVEEPVVEEVVEETEEEAAQTFDFGVIAAVAALVSAAGYALSKKR
ncbi:hypothetical protein J6B78_06335 [Methanocorpusculum sp.]|nr:hypothetical protein [Methanocorpusculum sp.]